MAKIAEIDKEPAHGRYSEDEYHFGFPLYPNAPVAGYVGHKGREWRLTIEYKSAVNIRFTKTTISGWVLCARGSAGSIFSTPVPSLGTEMRTTDVYPTYERAAKAYESMVSTLTEEMRHVRFYTPRSVQCRGCERETLWRVGVDEDGKYIRELHDGFQTMDCHMYPWTDSDVVFGCAGCFGA
jgi:hypothetical protein